MVIKEKFTLNMEGLSRGLDFVQTELAPYVRRSSELFKAMMLAEEFIIKMIDNLPASSEAQEVPTYIIALHERFKIAYITISAKGSPMDFSQVNISQDLDFSDMDYDIEQGIRNILLRSYKSRVIYSYRENVHKAKIKVGNVDALLIEMSLIMLILGITLGLLMNAFDSPYLVPLETFFRSVTLLFIKALNLCIMPVIFLGVLSTVIHAGGFLHPGRAGGKIIISYSLSSIMAILIGLGIFQLINPGTENLLSGFIDLSSSTDASTASLSIQETFVNLIPMDLVSPFAEGQSLQVIFMAVICGIAITFIGSTNSFLIQLTEALNELMEKILQIIAQVLPIAVLCSSVTITSALGVGSVLNIFAMVGTLILALAALCASYCLLIAVLGRLNPIPLVRKFVPNIKKLLVLTAGDERIMQIMRFSKNDIGINHRLASFAVPLGSTLNLDGQCIYLAVIAPFIAKICGVTLYDNQLLYLVITIILLSLGAPNMFGSGLVCMTAIMTQCQIPLIGLATAVMVDFLFGMVLSITNSFGDIVSMTIVARSEKMLDLKKYYRKNKK